jgi:hypothetical protein
MGELVCLEKYKEKVIEEELTELRKELELIMSSLPEEESSGYFLSLEEMDNIEKIWLNERNKK